jgi:hypothetical protein
MKCLEFLFCYNFVNEVTDEEEDVLLVAKPNLFTTSTITLPKPKIFTTMATNATTNMHAKIGIDAKIDMKIDIDEPIFDFSHTLNQISIDIMPIRMKVYDTKMGKWNIPKEV